MYVKLDPINARHKMIQEMIINISLKLKRA